jgi:hypothetical protein
MDYTRIKSLQVCCLLLLTCAHEWPCAVFCCEKESCDSHEILKKDWRWSGEKNIICHKIVVHVVLFGSSIGKEHISNT